MVFNNIEMIDRYHSFYARYCVIPTSHKITETQLGVVIVIPYLDGFVVVC